MLLKLCLRCLERLLVTFSVFGALYTLRNCQCCRLQHSFIPEWNLWVRAINMAFILFLFLSDFFFFQRENETQKLLCVLEVHSLQFEKCGIRTEPLKLPWQRNALGVGTKLFRLWVFFSTRWKAYIIYIVIQHSWGIKDLFDQVNSTSQSVVSYQ